MLERKPPQRISAAQCLARPLFAGMRSPGQQLLEEEEEEDALPVEGEETYLGFVTWMLSDGEEEVVEDEAVGEEGLPFEEEAEAEGLMTSNE